MTDMLKTAMRIHADHYVARYLLACTRSGAEKAEMHQNLVTFYVAVAKGCRLEDVRRRYENEYKRIHDLTAHELTDHLDTEIGFEVGAFVSDDLCRKFFNRFHTIAMDALTIGPEPDARPAQP